MKSFIVQLVALTLVTFTACSNDVLTPTKDLLGQSEVEDLLYLYEEEKMARDLYEFGRDKYGTNQFTNIMF